MGSNADRVWQSYQRCLENYSFLHEFYLRFIDSSPEVAQKFADTDMDHQVMMLRASLDLMLGGENLSAERSDLSRIAELHSRKGVGVPPQLYDHWLESLMITVKHFDKALDDELEQAWRDLLGSGIDYMKGAY